MNIRLEKQEVRTLYRQKRQALAAEERERRDAVICRRIRSLVSYRYAGTLLAYAPKGCEIDIRPVIEAALFEGKRVALPRCEEGNQMTFRRIASLAELEPGAYGIAEPRADAPLYEEEAAMLCLVPGIVFSRDGFRIGYGGGYYDRFLRDFSGTTLGIVYRDFLLPTLPRGRMDLSVNALVTEAGVIPCLGGK